MRNVFKFGFFYIIAFIIICLSVGQMMGLLLTHLIFGVDITQIVNLLNNPVNTDKQLIIFLTIFNSLFSFLVIPIAYILFYNKALLSNLLTNNKIRPISCLLAFISLLIKFNSSIEFPIWLSGLERYIKESEEKATQLTNSLLFVTDSKDLIIILIVMAIIPGIVEEIFFRGIIQTQLQQNFKSYHYAIILSSFLFSFFHFQFFSFIPRFILGMLLGYIFKWSKNIWYSCAAHITNNLIVIIIYTFSKGEMKFDENEFPKLVILSVFSFILTALTLFYLNKIERKSNLIASNKTNN